jgi:hypothetical protein
MLNKFLNSLSIIIWHKAWVFMATTRRVLAHTMSWNGQHRHNNEDTPGEAKTFKQVVHTSGNNRDASKECLLTWRSFWGCTRYTDCIKSKVDKVEFIESDIVHINVGACSRLSVHIHKGIIVSTRTCTCWLTCAYAIWKITIMCAYARGHDCACIASQQRQ